MKNKRLFDKDFQNKTMQHLRQKLFPLSCFLLLFLSIACQENTYYHFYQPVDPTGWDKNDTLIYDLPSPLPKSHSLEFLIGIRHKDSYIYRDLWLTINLDTIHLYLADSTGNWSGSGLGELRQVTFPIPLQIKGDTISHIRITHIMQDNPLSGIHDIGIQIREED